MTYWVSGAIQTQPASLLAPPISSKAKRRSPSFTVCNTVRTCANTATNPHHPRPNPAGAVRARSRRYRAHTEARAEAFHHRALDALAASGGTGEAQPNSTPLQKACCADRSDASDCSTTASRFATLSPSYLIVPTGAVQRAQLLATALLTGTTPACSPAAPPSVHSRPSTDEPRK